MSSPSKGSSFGKSLSPFANLQVQCTRFGLSYVFWLYLQVLWLDSGYWLFLLRGALPSIKESPVAQHIDITNASIRKLSRQQLQNQVLGHANDRVFQCSSWIEKFKKSLNLGWLEIDVLGFFSQNEKRPLTCVWHQGSNWKPACMKDCFFHLLGAHPSHSIFKLSWQRSTLANALFLYDCYYHEKN